MQANGCIMYKANTIASTRAHWAVSTTLHSMAAECGCGGGGCPKLAHTTQCTGHASYLLAAIPLEADGDAVLHCDHGASHPGGGHCAVEGANAAIVRLRAKARHRSLHIACVLYSPLPNRHPKGFSCKNRFLRLGWRDKAAQSNRDGNPQCANSAMEKNLRRSTAPAQHG